LTSSGIYSAGTATTTNQNQGNTITYNNIYNFGYNYNWLSNQSVGGVLWITTNNGGSWDIENNSIYEVLSTFLGVNQPAVVIWIIRFSAYFSTRHQF